MELSVFDDQPIAGDNVIFNGGVRGNENSLLFNEWAQLVELTKILQPFKEQTDAMQTDTLALSNIIPCLLELTLNLQDPSVTKTALAVPLLQALRRRFSIFFLMPPLPLLAVIMD